MIAPFKRRQDGAADEHYGKRNGDRVHVKVHVKVHVRIHVRVRFRVCLRFHLRVDATRRWFEEGRCQRGGSETVKE